MDAADLEAQRLLAVLARRTRPEQAVGMGDLYRLVFGEDYEHKINHTRRLRKLIHALQQEGVRICSTDQGYFLAARAGDLEAYVRRRLEEPALRKLAKAARLKRVALPELLGQLALEQAAASSQPSERKAHGA